MNESSSEKNRSVDNATLVHDEILVRNAVRLLVEISQLLPELPRLREIVKDENHPAFLPADEAQRDLVDPEVRAFSAKMRQAQIGALIRVAEVIYRCMRDTTAFVKTKDQSLKKEAMDRVDVMLGLNIKDAPEKE